MDWPGVRVSKKKKGACGISPGSRWADEHGEMVVLAVVNGWVMWQRGNWKPQVHSTATFRKMCKPVSTPET